MSKLTQYIQKHQLDPIKVMNALQNQGIVSDVCVTHEDVPDCDSDSAIKFLEKCDK